MSGQALTATTLRPRAASGPLRVMSMPRGQGWGGGSLGGRSWLPCGAASAVEFSIDAQLLQVGVIQEGSVPLPACGLHQNRRRDEREPAARHRRARLRARFGLSDLAAGAGRRPRNRSIAKGVQRGHLCTFDVSRSGLPVHQQRPRHGAPDEENAEHLNEDEHGRHRVLTTSATRRQGERLDAYGFVRQQSKLPRPSPIDPSRLTHEDLDDATVSAHHRVVVATKPGALENRGCAMAHVRHSRLTAAAVPTVASQTAQSRQLVPGDRGGLAHPQTHQSAAKTHPGDEVGGQQASGTEGALSREVPKLGHDMHVPLSVAARACLPLRPRPRHRYLVPGLPLRIQHDESRGSAKVTDFGPQAPHSCKPAPPSLQTAKGTQPVRLRMLFDVYEGVREVPQRAQRILPTVSALPCHQHLAWMLDKRGQMSTSVR